MFTNRNKNIKCLWVLYGLCTVLVCLSVIYLEQDTLKFDIALESNEVLSNPNQLINLNDFAYLLTSGRCTNQTFALLLVTSYAGDVETRRTVRKAYPKKLLSELGIKRVFLLARIGKNKNPTHIEQEAIINENKHFGDILQGNFVEDYRNLTYKHVMGLRWASKNCPDVPYIIKMDHDIAVDLFSITNLIRKLPQRERILAGYVMMNMKPIREPVNKWYVTDDEYSREKYPDFLSGWLYITNPFTAGLLYKMSRTVPYFWIDDTYVTGILAEKMNLTLVKLNKYYTTHPEHLQCCIEKPKYQCDFWVGPNGGKNFLLRSFERYAESCFKNKCKKRLHGGSVRDNCIARWASDQFGRPLPETQISG